MEKLISDMTTLTPFITITLSFGAFVLSIITLILSSRSEAKRLRLSKHQLLIQASTASRNKWIESVRQLLSEFADTYIDYKENAKTKNDLLKMKLHIDLYLNDIDHNQNQDQLSKFMDSIIVNPSSWVDISKEYASLSQKVLDDAWERLKMEDEFAESSEKEIQKKTYNQ
jgi:hypothetical protein